MFHTKVKILVVTVLWVQIVMGGDMCYKLDFSDKPRHCPDYKNDKFDPTSLEMTPKEAEDGEEKVVGLSGLLFFYKEIKDGYKVNLEIMQETEMGRDPVMSAVADICSSLSDTDAPWWPVFEAMNVSSCPIATGEYLIKDLILKLDFAKDILTHQYVGEYFIQMLIKDKADQLACFEMGAAISEFDCPEE